MRISDWSSDVCSSDLRRPLTPTAQRVFLVAERCGCAPQKSQSPRIVSAANRYVAGISSSITHKSGSARLRRANYSDISSSLRSEEHTSELQSLMRISYAVFCLTKKTTVTLILILL